MVSGNRRTDGGATERICRAGEDLNLRYTRANRVLASAAHSPGNASITRAVGQFEWGGFGEVFGWAWNRGASSGSPVRLLAVG